jgi:hypothetical protein
VALAEQTTQLNSIHPDAVAKPNNPANQTTRYVNWFASVAEVPDQGQGFNESPVAGAWLSRESEAGTKLIVSLPIVFAKELEIVGSRVSHGAAMRDGVVVPISIRERRKIGFRDFEPIARPRHFP